ncbi:coiled-coil domain-containing protein 106-like [Lampris incognitus]|uniref:coiled-coil domain-containing protein 106-like n=1 Tax=Lampris incognitus TaxID=2546036 RepID=UPI0024B60F6C|nr:coiled-coil domain-containing protein 106-like [Lampris incognitus]
MAVARGLQAAEVRSSSAELNVTRRAEMYPDSYEVPLLLEENKENVERRSIYHINQNQESVMAEPPQYSPIILINNLRTHLYVSLEKNTWLQKRIEELEDERNFLRCQLDRFIVGMRSQEGEASQKIGVNRSPTSSPALLSPMTTRSGMAIRRLQDQAPCTRRSTTIPVKEAFHLEEDKYYTEEEFLEDEEEEETDDEDYFKEKGSGKARRGRAGREPRMKMRRIFRITHGRERQRVKDSDGVLMRYKKILYTYQKVRSMSKAFQIHGVDRNTMASTSPIAELLLVAPEKLAEVGEFEASKEKLLDYARRCYKMMDDETHTKVQAMKKSHKLLPISYRFRN